MTFRLNDEERRLVLRALKARFDALQTEKTKTDNPEFNIQLQHEDKVIQALIERLDSSVPTRPPKNTRSAPRGGTRTRRR
jgi:hypothetical protein